MNEGILQAFLETYVVEKDRQAAYVALTEIWHEAYNDGHEDCESE